MTDKRTDQLPAADPLDGSEEIAIVQDGNSRRATAEEIANVQHDHAIDDVVGLQAALDGRQAWDFNFAGDSDAFIYAHEAMTIAEVDTTGVGTVAYEQSTAASPDTFAPAAAPVTIEAGAKLKVSASAVTAPFAVHLQRSA